MTTVALLGAHTAVARALIERLEERETEVELIRATTSDFIDAGLELLTPELVLRADLLVLCMRAEGIGLLEAPERIAKPLVDVSGTAWPGEPSLLWPGLDPGAGRDLARGLHALPVGLASPVVAAAAALVPLGLTRVFVATLESAALYDQPGIDALSEQVRAVFTMQDVVPSCLEVTLAFNAVPAVGADPAGAERRLAREIERGLATVASRVPVVARRTLVPTFTAEGAWVELTMDTDLDRARVEAALREARGLALKSEPAAALDASGRDDALLSCLDVAPGRVGFWLASDRLRRGSASQAALVIETFCQANATGVSS